LLRPVSLQLPSPAAFPGPLGRRSRGHAGCHRASGTRRLSDSSRGFAPHCASAYRVAYPAPPRTSARPPAVTPQSSAPSRPHTPWCEECTSTPSPPSSRLYLVSSLADRFLVGIAPIDDSPVLLRTPIGFHLAMDTRSSPTSRWGQ